MTADRTTRMLLSVALALAATPACSGPDSETLLGPPVPGNDDTGDAKTQAWYVVHSTVESPDARLGYFATTPDIDGSAPIDVTRGLEVPGGGRLYVKPGIGNFLVGGGESPTLTRYEVGADGRLLPGSVLSFANQGISEMGDDAIVFVSPSQAYYRDAGQLQLVSFDPTRMEILASVPVDGVVREGFLADFGAAIVRADGVYFPVSYYPEDDDLSKLPRGSTLVHIAPDTDQVTVTTDARCTSMYSGFSNENGDAYWFSNAPHPPNWRDNTGPHDCALRLRADESSFDPTWQLDLTTRTSQAASSAIVSAGGSLVWLRVFDEARRASSAEPDAGSLEELNFWQWYLLDLEGTRAALRNDERPVGTVYAYAFMVDGRTFVTEEHPDEFYSDTTLFEITEQGFRQGSNVLGTWRGLARIQ